MWEMTTADLAAAVQAVAAVIAAITTIAIAWMVHDYTNRRDKTAIIHEMWKQQQDWNLQAAGSPAHAKATEQMVYGGIPANEEERHALNACMFFFINRINHIYDAYCLKILSRADFEAEARGTIRLVAGQKELLFALLDNRGYDSELAAEVKKLVHGVTITGPVNVFTNPRIGESTASG